MKLFLRIAAIVLAFLAVRSPAATTRFVDLNCPNPTPPYTNWQTAATNIQDASAISLYGDTVLVTNGVYQYGGDSFGGSNRVDISATVQSVNGPAVTIIKGYQVPGTTNGSSAVRCVYLREFGKLFGFTVTGGATPNSGGLSMESGGGIITETSCVISNCIITGNASYLNGAGAYLGAGTTVFNSILSGNRSSIGGMGGGAAGLNGPTLPTLVNCVVSNNYAQYGGGVAFCSVFNSLLVGNTNNSAYISRLNNCTLTGNYGYADGCALNNSIIYYNITGFYADCYQCNLTNCCTTIGNGTPSLANNSFSNAPGFVNPSAGDYHLLPWSRCIDTGNNAQATNSVDLDGNPRIVGAAVDVGAYEAQSAFQGVAHYVSLHSTNPVPPYASWSTAATNLQDGVGAAQAGEYVIADDGVYTNSGTVMFGVETNRVVVTNGVTLASAGGPIAAIISGAIQTRCAYVGSNSTLVGFTLTGGRGRSGGDLTNEESGSGVWCEIGGTISNCVVAGNFNIGGGPMGGGIFRGSVYNTIISSNSSATGSGGAFGNYFNCYFVSNGVGYGGSGGGIYRGVASNCTFVANGQFYGTIGGGACQSTLYNCTLATNFGTYGGGGADSCTLYGCTLIKNQSTTSGGGGARLSTNYNCIFLNNFANAGGAVYGGYCSGCLLSNNFSQYNGGGANQATLTNCILVGNLATNAFAGVGNGLGGGSYQGTVLNCLVFSNTAANYGGGIYQGAAWNSTIVGNTATNTGGGTYGSQVYNSIVYYNIAGTASNYSGGNFSSCCTTPLPLGAQNCFTNDPLLVNLALGDLHLQSNSPCINSGNNNFVNGPVKLTSDFEGNPRIIGGTVDVGAYEFPNPASMLSYVWLYSYGFALDGSADFADADGDGMSNYAEWRAKTNPTDASSVLALQPPVVTETNATITWQSVGGVQYYIQSTPDFIAQPFQSLASNIVGSAGTTSYIDTNAMGGVTLFYRVGVQ
jgi:hypothetical protein